LSFSWDTLASAQTALDRLRTIYYDLDEIGLIDEDYMDRFVTEVNDDLNMPRALAVTWDLARSNLTGKDKKATLATFDRVLGLGLDQWQPDEEVIPDDISRLVKQRQHARESKNWSEADALREKIKQLGFEVKDTSSGPIISKIN
jgi:cysteinyl-tRNA synthetase